MIDKENDRYDSSRCVQLYGLQKCKKSLFCSPNEPFQHGKRPLMKPVSGVNDDSKGRHYDA